MIKYQSIRFLKHWIFLKSRQKPLRETKFILDVHLGKLAKYLRMFGFDTLYQNNYSDKEIISISITEHRIILTRDIGLLKVKIVTHGYFIRNDIPEEQIKEVLDHFDLYQLINPFARCLKCNGLLEKVQKDEVLPQLQKLTIMYFNDFLKCKNCQRVYWDGSHYDRMKTFIESIINSKFNASNQKG